MRLRVFFLSFIFLAITACNTAVGTPYENVHSCQRDKECSKWFQEYRDCTAQYETGC